MVAAALSLGPGYEPQPIGRCFGPGDVRGYYLDLPAGRLDAALEHARESVTALEVSDPTGRLPYALTYLMAIHEERGEDADALAAAERTRAIVP